MPLSTSRWLRLLRRVCYCRRGHHWMWRRDGKTWYLECAGCLSISEVVCRIHPQ